MANWLKVDPKKLKESVGPEVVKEMTEHAAESHKLTRRLLRLTVPSGDVVVTHGPIPMPMPGPGGGTLPPSAMPQAYTIVWLGKPGAAYPSEVDNNVLLQIQRRDSKSQMWAVDTAADVIRIIKSAFGLDVSLPAEEPRS